MTGQACARVPHELGYPAAPEVAAVAERWGATAVGMQAEQQKLVAAAEDMEQHSLDIETMRKTVSEQCVRLNQLLATHQASFG